MNHKKLHLGNIQLNDLSARINSNRQQIDTAIRRVLDSGWLILGPEVRNFEHAFSDYVGAAHCVGVANGTDAIEIGLRAVGVEAGDLVATVANAGGYTSTAVRAIGATPWFMDVDPATYLVTAAGVSAAIRAGVKALVVTHLYGLALEEIVAIGAACKEAGIFLVEDCAQAHGARVGSKRAGSFGDIGCFSFYPTKNLGALGDGGAVVTSDDGLATRIELLRHYGWEAKYRIGAVGGRNSRLDEVQAAVLMAFLDDLDDTNARRRDIANRYSTEIDNDKIQTPRARGEEYVAHLYVIRSGHRDTLRDHLLDHGIATDIHYPIPDHRQSVFGERFAGLRLCNTEMLAREILTLPCYPEIPDEHISHVISVLNRWRP